VEDSEWAHCQRPQVVETGTDRKRVVIAGSTMRSHHFFSYESCFFWEKSYFQPLTITIVRFSTLNSKTRHLAPSNYRNRAKYPPKPNPPRFSATSPVHVAPMATSATLSSLFLSQTGGPPPLLSLLSFSSHPLLSRRTPSPAPLLAPPLAGAAPRTPVAGARRRPHSPLLPAGPWRALTLLSSPRRRRSWLACRPRAAAELARRPACRVAEEQERE